MSLALVALLAIFAQACAGSEGGEGPDESAQSADVDDTAGGEDSATDDTGAQADDGAPEQADLNVVYFPSGLGIPVMVAHEEGYYADHGLNVELHQLASGAAVAALASGEIDIYFGGAAAVSGMVAGHDLLYVAAPVDTPPVKLMVKPEIESFADLEGGLIATTGAGAFGEILIRRLADEHDLSVDKGDINLLYNRNNEAAVAQLLQGQVDAAIVTAPAHLEAENAGFPMLIDFSTDYDAGIIGPGVAVRREWMEENPNTIRAFLRGHLEGVHAALNNPESAKEHFSSVTGTTEPEVIESAYELNRPLWNVDFTVDPEHIKTVLNYTPGLSNVASDVDVERFYDNRFVFELNEEFAPALFPNEDFQTSPSA